MSYILLDNNLFWGRMKRLLGEIAETTGITTSGLAREIVLSYLSNNRKENEDIPVIQEVTGSAAAFVLRSVALEACAKEELSFYTNQMLEDGKTCTEIYRIITTLRLEKEIDGFEFDINNRIKDLGVIKERYLKKLVDNNIYDTARFVCDAVEYLKDDTFRKSFLENLNAPIEENYYIESFHLSELTYKEKEFERLLNVKDIKDDLMKDINATNSMHFYRTYGLENEIRYIVKTIKDQSIPYGSINIFYSSDKYEGYIRSALGREGIPYSFVTGRVTTDRYTSLMKSIISFALNDFQYIDFVAICSNSLMSNKCFGINLHRDKEIGWGKETFLFNIKENIKTTNEKLVEDNEELERLLKKYDIEENIESDIQKIKEEPKEIKEKRKSIEKLEKRLEYYQMAEALLNVFDEANYQISDVYNRLCDFLSDYTNKSNQDRATGLKVLKDKKVEVNSIGNTIKSPNLQYSLKIIDDYIDNIKSVDGERSDNVTVSKINTPVISDRKTHFFIGMSFSEFNEKTSDSPVMSDTELMEAVVEPGILAKDNNRNREDSVKTTIGLLRGDVYLSYSYYDTGEILECSPSDIYLDYLEENGKKLEAVDKLSFEELGNDRLIFSTKNYGEIIEELDKKAEEKKRVRDEKWEEYIKENFPELLEIDADVNYHNDDDEGNDDKAYDDKGESYDVDDEAYEGNNEDYDNEDEAYDDNDDEKDDDEEEDCTKTVNLILSASKIQVLLNCEREYSYQYERFVPGEDDYSVDIDKWLPHNVRGTYLHEVLEKYFDEVADDKGKLPDAFQDKPIGKNETCEEILDNIIKDTFDLYTKKYPYRSKEIAVKTNEEYTEKLKDYLKYTHEEFKREGFCILCSEGHFLSGDIIDIDFNDELEDKDYEYKITIDGRMDRIDYKIDDNGEYIYRIVDYKSGRMESLKEELDSEQLRKIQHELYMRLLTIFAERGLSFEDNKGKEIITPKGSCERAEYHFILEDKPENRVIECNKSDDIYNEMILRLCSYYGDIEIDEEKIGEPNCKYCQYKSLCNLIKTQN